MPVNSRIRFCLLLALVITLSAFLQTAQAQVYGYEDATYAQVDPQYTPIGVAIRYETYENPGSLNPWSIGAGATGTTLPSYTIIDSDAGHITLQWNTPGDANVRFYRDIKPPLAILAVHVVNCAPVLGAVPKNPFQWGEMGACPTTMSSTVNTDPSVSCFLDDYYPGSTSTSPTNSAAQPSPDVYYHFTLSQSCLVTAKTCGSGFDTYLHIRSRTTGAIWDNDNGASCGSGASQLRLVLPVGDYELIAEGAGTSFGNLHVEMTTQPAAPVVRIASGTTTVTDDIVDVASGGTTTLTAQLSGNNNPTFTWLPATGLNTSTGAAVSATPTETTTYRVTATYCNGLTVSAQVTVRVIRSNKNFITTRTPQVANKRTLYDLNGLSPTDLQVTTQYFDGLGRPEQTVARQSSPTQPNALDLVTPMGYDASGRPALMYLPYAGGTDGAFKTNALAAQATAYGTSSWGDRIANDASPWARKVYEQSPLNQVREQGMPGAAWQPGTGHTIKTTTRSNEANEVRRWVYAYAIQQWSSPGYYPAGTLTVQETRDEHDVLTVEYQDKEGHVVLKKTQITATPGALCVMQAAGSTLQFPVPTGTRLRGIQSAIWGRLATGSGTTCADAVFDPSGSVDVTAKAQQLLTALGAPVPFSLLASNALAPADPAPTSSKWLKVVVNFAPTGINDYLSTYYGYDDFGLLRLVIQPKGTQLLSTLGTAIGPYSTSDELIAKLSFTYDYDARHRVITKSVPGGGTTSMLYDRANRVVGTQDQQQAQSNGWHITKYDALNRPVITAFTTVSGNRQTLQAILDDPLQSPQLNEKRASAGVGYTLNQAYPIVNDQNLRTLTFYDDYTYPTLVSKPFQNNQNGVLSTAVISQVQGQVTGRAEYPLEGSATPLTTALYYDEQYRPIQVQSDLVGGTTCTTSQLDFVHVLSSLTTHTVGSTPHTIRNRFTYDVAGRPLRVFQQMEYGLAAGFGVAEVLVAENEYNDIGQLVDKKLHSTDWSTAGTGLSFLQSVDYRYNIRGWLTNINNRSLSNNPNDRFNDADANQDDLSKTEPDLFGMELMYDKNQNLYNPGQSASIGKGQFNGNISEVMWQTRGRNDLRVLRGYAYNYDNANRINEAQYRTYEYDGIRGGYAWGNTTSNFTVPRVQYDANGNITRLERKGLTNIPGAGIPVYGNLDQLSYSYEGNGNQLVGVDEDVSSAMPNGLVTAATHDFEDNGHRYSKTSPEYSYDAAGNMLTDKNKGIEYVYYNELNLPWYIYLNNYNQCIHYVYLANGTKLQKVTIDYNTGVQHTTDYRNGFVYQDGVLSFAPMPEGRVIYTPNVAAGNYDWKYEYHLKDQLGNLRFAFRDYNGNAQQRTASMEPANAPKEEQEFAHVAETRQRDVQRARTGEYVARLSAAEGRREGPSISWPVQAGDSVTAEVYGRYDHSAAAGRLLRTGAVVVGAGVAGSAGTLATDLNQAAPARRRALPYLGLSLAVVPQLFKPKHDELPQAFLRYELFDQDSQLVSTQIRPLQRTASDEWQHLETGVKADSAGYVRVSVVNESKTPAYFDDLALRPVDPNEFQENHYDPWGLNLVGIEDEGNPDSKFQFNGKEKQENFGLNWTDFGARMYDSQLGRWHVTDAASYMTSSSSPYNYCKDNPLRNIDPTGHYTIDIQLSKEEMAQLKGLKGAERRDAERKMKEPYEKQIRDAIGNAKNTLDNNQQAKDAFMAFSGVQEFGNDGKTTEQWTNLWTENGKGPKVGGKPEKGNAGGTRTNAFGGARVDINASGSAAEGVVSVLHEYVHYGDTQVRPDTGEPRLEGGVQGISDPRYGNSQFQINALQQAAASDINGFMGAYPGYITKEGKALLLEIGYSFEQAAFGHPIVTKEDYDKFTNTYLNKGGK